MLNLPEATRMVRRRHTENPRTVLGFYATVLGLLFAGIVGVVVALASAKVMTDAIPWLLAFAGFVFVALVAGVFVVALVDPSKLMLGRITGSEYAEIQKLTLGNSRTGERELPISQSGPGDPVILSELPSGEVAKDPTDDSNEDE